ncbi:MAG: hypothetical protein NTY61_01790, partial [Candidatus Parcubacteria bacterium]|nr:hypothetical protein [Candidatus Parcubacteria bacterium]
MEDKAVPAHTRLDAHPDGDPYEDWASKQNNINFNAAPIVVNQLSEAFDDLAVYSNKYFLSKDTIVGLEKSSIVEKEIKTDEGKYVLYGFSNDSNGREFRIFKIEKTFDTKKYSLDNPVHSDYFSLLAPKAISYGAGVINLFIQEGERRKQIENSKSWWQKLKENIFAGIGGSLTTGLSSSLISAIVPEPANQVAPSEATPAG